jgi:hypothetical protein
MAQAPHTGSDPRVDALAPGVDDIGNASGLSAPAIIRGTVYAHLANGVTVGAGQNTAIRTATLAGLNAAIAYAGSVGKFFEIEPGTYEIYGSGGLVVPAQTNNAIYWKGSNATTIVQYSTNTPVLTLGDATGANTIYGLKFDGVTLEYGVSQTGNTGAIACLSGPSAWCVLESIGVSATSGGYYPITNPSYIAFATTTGGVWFNNAVRDMHLFGAQQTLLLQQAQGTGNEWSNIYVSNGSNNDASESVYGALSGPAIQVGNSSFSTESGNVWTRVNIESVKCAYAVLLIQEAQSNTFHSLHFENLEMTASNTALIQNVGSNVNMTAVETYDIQVPAGLTGISVLANNNGGEVNLIDGLRMGWSTYSDPGLNSPMMIVNSGGASADQNERTVIRGFVITDGSTNNATQMSIWNGTYPITGYSSYDGQIGTLTVDQLQARTEGYVPSITTTTYTHYGCHADATIIYPATLPAAATITLSNKKYPSGLGSSLATPTGLCVQVRRTGGTYANTLTIKDGASGSTLVTNSTNSTGYLFTFNGTNWVAAT